MSRWTTVRNESGSVVLGLEGDWTLVNLQAVHSSLEELAPEVVTSVTVVDASALGALDTAGSMTLLRYLERGKRDLKSVTIRNFRPKNAEVLELARKSISEVHSEGHPETPKFFVELGKATFDVFYAVESILRFVGLTFMELLRALVHPASLRLKELFVQVESCGLNAVPIVFLVNFLIGIVIAYLSGVQLEYYGANVFVVDGVGLAVVRELSPILVAIIVAGRSGSAFTAQIGSMKLNEEVDAIATLGLSPVRVLVMPRLLALIFVMPILVFVGDIAGILGGMLIADLRLGVTGATFVDRLRIALTMTHVFAGLAKAPFFAFFIATIGCRMGLEVENNARSVGLNTTATVVRSIVVVILLNAAFAVIYSELGI